MINFRDLTPKAAENTQNYLLSCMVIKNILSRYDDLKHTFNDPNFPELRFHGQKAGPLVIVSQDLKKEGHTACALFWQNRIILDTERYQSLEKFAGSNKNMILDDEPGQKVISSLFHEIAHFAQLIAPREVSEKDWIQNIYMMEHPLFKIYLENDANAFAISVLGYPEPTGSYEEIFLRLLPDWESPKKRRTYFEGTQNFFLDLYGVWHPEELPGDRWDPRHLDPDYILEMISKTNAEKIKLGMGGIAFLDQYLTFEKLGKYMPMDFVNLEIHACGYPARKNKTTMPTLPICGI